MRNTNVVGLTPNHGLREAYDSLSGLRKRLGAAEQSLAAERERREAEIRSTL